MEPPHPSVAVKGDQWLQDVGAFGLKASGLSQLPDEWTPPFIAVRVGLLEDLKSNQRIRGSLAWGLSSLGPSSEDGVIVRSSGVNESLDRRGALDSHRCENKIDDVVAQTERIAANASERERATLGFVIQNWVSPAMRGHLSNERRISHDPRRWAWEPEVPIGGSTEDRSFPLRVDSNVTSIPTLECGSVEDLPKCLRAVARNLTQGDPRSHLEWVWDGSRIWIVQYDEEHAQPGEPPASGWKGDPVPALNSPLRIFKEASAGDTGFPKAEHVRIFANAGLPHGDVRILRGSLVIRNLAQGKVSRELARDLRTLIEHPVVVRTDTRAEVDHPELMSMRTDVCMSYEQLEDFLVQTADWAITQGAPPGDVAFLIHRFLLADAGAFGFARPGSSRVLIDATWGTPDSLLFHPHDSFRVDIDSRLVERHLRCKTDFIDVDENGGWLSRPAGVPWDWKPVLSDELALQVADICSTLADKLEMDVEVMFFIGAHAIEAPSLPWFFSSPRQPRFDVEQSRGYYSGERLTIRNERDLAKAEQTLEAQRGAKVTLTIRPDVALVRSKEFLQRVATVAQRFNTPVELEGSRLTHAYYLLEDAGARVRCVDPWGDTDRRQSFGKLVRDLIPVRIQRRGERALVYSANRSELATLIRAKVIEEAVEYYWASGQDASVQELADLLELLQAAARIHEVEFEEVEREASRKREERGGFESGIVLVETQPGMPLPGAGSTQAPSMSGALSEEGGAAEELPPGLAERRVIRLPGRRLLLPVAPPSGWQENRSNEVVLDADEEASITYGPTTIQIQIRPRQRGPGRNQLEMDI
jgi:predicted house-cleaning noncanonical NTP pyrophosphatase (MazG superfamily)